jgi:hypothetical protein
MATTEVRTARSFKATITIDTYSEREYQLLTLVFANGHRLAGHLLADTKITSEEYSKVQHLLAGVAKVLRS